jgi:hypothetical protein
VSCKLLIVLVLGAAQTARAERAIDVEAAGAPFAPEELVAALRVRISADGAPVRIRVTAIDQGVRIESHGAVRDVPLADLHGGDAARLVALAADDLLLDDLAAPPPSLPRARTTTLGVLGGAAAWDGTLGDLAVDLAMPRGPLVLAVEADVARMFGGTLAMTAATLRATAGVRTGWLELRGGLTLLPLFVTTGAGDATVLVGAGASARVHVPVTSSVSGVLAGGIDAFATRTEYRITGMPAMTTPRWAPWFALGIEVPL